MRSWWRVRFVALALGTGLAGSACSLLYPFGSSTPGADADGDGDGDADGDADADADAGAGADAGADGGARADGGADCGECSHCYCVAADDGLGVDSAVNARPLDPDSGCCIGIEGTLVAGSEHWYSVTLGEGERLTVVPCSQSPDLFLFVDLYAAAAPGLNVNHAEVGGQRCASAMEYRAPAAGAYTIHLGVVDGQGGDYTMTLFFGP